MAETSEYNLKLTTKEQYLLILALVARRQNKINEYPCFSNSSCDECPVFNHRIQCSQHLMWISEIKQIDNLLNKLGDLKEEKEEL